MIRAGAPGAAAGLVIGKMCDIAYEHVKHNNNGSSNLSSDNQTANNSPSKTF